MKDGATGKILTNRQWATYHQREIIEVGGEKCLSQMMKNLANVGLFLIALLLVSLLELQIFLEFPYLF